MSSVKQKITLWEFFQSLGKTFMLPVALLSFCGIMLGIGSSLSSHDVITLIPFLGNPLLQLVFTWMSKVGSFAFSFLPVMFAIAIPLGILFGDHQRRNVGCRRQTAVARQIATGILHGGFTNQIWLLCHHRCRAQLRIR